MKDTFISKLCESIEKNLPGPAVQSLMSPQLRLENHHGFYRNAAVLIMLYKDEDNWKIVLMKRPEYVGAHSKQISLPGGIHEDSDPDMQATALRETREELGIDESKIQVLGKLSKLSIPVSGIEVSPFVGLYYGKPFFEPDSKEVEYLIEVTLQDLLAAENTREEIRTLMCKLVKVPYYSVCGEKVWGATAMILSEFLAIVRNLGEVDPQ